MKEPRWDHLKTVLVLARSGSLQAAARQLGTNHTTVYRQVRAFEEAVGLRLFESTPGGYRLTAQGDKFLETASGLDQQVADLFRSLQGMDASLSGSLCVTTTSSLATTLLPPIWKRFRETWPDLSVELKVSNTFFNLSKREADIAIRPSSDVPDYLVGRNLGPLHFGVFAAESYLNRAPKQPFPEQMEGHDFIGLDDSLGHLLSKKWLDDLIGPNCSVYRVDNLSVLGHLCEAGLGIAVLPLYFRVRHPDLRLIYQPERFLGSDLWLLTHRDLSQTAKVQTCMDFLAGALKKALQPFQ
ncbi:MAG: LysR family transcriptional regulator [Acidobacteria bacterium]|nr:LysR family transcriptional regulator [Acidobacteriota bacterium]